MKETALSKSIRKALESIGCWVDRYQSGVIPALYGGKQRFIHCAEKGSPDLIILSPVMGFIEVKTKTGRLSDDQKAWHEKAAKAGVRVAVVRSVKEALEVVALWRRDRRVA
jgi:hypothetical protein